MNEMTKEAKGLGDWFERRTRDGGAEFVTLKDGHPTWLKDAVRAAHTDTLPNDWIYDACKAACDAIDDGQMGDGEDDHDDVHQFADSQTDVYTADRFRWAADMCLTTFFAEAEEAASELLSAECSTADRLGTIQFCAYERVAHAMLDAWREAREVEAVSWIKVGARCVIIVKNDDRTTERLPGTIFEVDEGAESVDVNLDACDEEGHARAMHAYFDDIEEGES